MERDTILGEFLESVELKPYFPHIFLNFHPLASKIVTDAAISTSNNVTSQIAATQSSMTMLGNFDMDKSGKIYWCGIKLSSFLKNNLKLR